MRPFLEGARDKVVLIPPCIPKKGDVVLAEISEKRYALHRVIKIENGTYTMRGDGNPLWMTEQFTYEKIIGIAQAFIRKGRREEVTGLKWRCYSVIWKALTPIRRILLAIYRRIK
jgi:hypothetical protein